MINLHVTITVVTQTNISFAIIFFINYMNNLKIERTDLVLLEIHRHY